MFCLFPPYIFFVFWPLDQTKQQYHWQMRKKLRCYPPSLRCMKSARDRVEKAIKATGAKCTFFTYFVGDSKERMLRWDCTASLRSLVLDDLISQCSNDQRVADLFTRGLHHRGISVLYLTQNIFQPGKLSRTISLNSHYLVIFRNPRDSLGISTLAKQIFPGRTDYLMESFRDATSRPYGYLVIDCHQLTPETMRLRTNVLPGERQIAYVKRT